MVICLDCGSESLLKIMNDDEMYRETCVDLCGNLSVEGTIWEDLIEINNYQSFGKQLYAVIRKPFVIVKVL